MKAFALFVGAAALLLLLTDATVHTETPPRALLEVAQRRLAPLGPSADVAAMDAQIRAAEDDLSRLRAAKASAVVDDVLADLERHTGRGWTWNAALRRVVPREDR